jgi:hypothetical protein
MGKPSTRWIRGDGTIALVWLARECSRVKRLKQALRRQREHIAPEFLAELEQPEGVLQEAANGKVLTLIRSFARAGLRRRQLHNEAHLSSTNSSPGRTPFAEGNQLHAAKILGIARQTLRNRLRELGLSIHKSVGGE